MDSNQLQRLAAKLDELLEHYAHLKTQNRLLLAHEKAWRDERAELIEKNELARQKVEAMISRLKTLEQDS